MHHPNTVWSWEHSVCGAPGRENRFLVIADSINGWQMICIMQYDEWARFVSITRHIQSLHKHCSIPFLRGRLALFWIAIHRSIPCLLETTGHNKWVILFTIKARVTKWIPLMFKFVFHAQLKRRGGQSRTQGEGQGEALTVVCLFI